MINSTSSSVYHFRASATQQVQMEDKSLGNHHKSSLDCTELSHIGQRKRVK